MKEFNLEQAKAGKPVCTRDGRNVRIICFDAKIGTRITIIALVKNINTNTEDLHLYTIRGRFFINGGTSDNDLFMKPEKKEGWINIYPSKCDEYVGGCSQIYSSEAIAISEEFEGRIATVKVEWEE
jgi:hypothetical protein